MVDFLLCVLIFCIILLGFEKLFRSLFPGMDAEARRRVEKACILAIIVFLSYFVWAFLPASIIVLFFRSLAFSDLAAGFRSGYRSFAGGMRQSREDRQDAGNPGRQAGRGASREAAGHEESGRLREIQDGVFAAVRSRLEERGMWLAEAGEPVRKWIAEEWKGEGADRIIESVAPQVVDILGGVEVPESVRSGWYRAGDPGASPGTYMAAGTAGETVPVPAGAPGQESRLQDPGEGPEAAGAEAARLSDVPPAQYGPGAAGIPAGNGITGDARPQGDAGPAPSRPAGQAPVARPAAHRDSAFPRTGAAGPAPEPPAAPGFREAPPALSREPEDEWTYV